MRTKIAPYNKLKQMYTEEKANKIYTAYVKELSEKISPHFDVASIDFSKAIHIFNNSGTRQLNKDEVELLTMFLDETIGKKLSEQAEILEDLHHWLSTLKLDEVVKDGYYKKEIQ